MGINKVILLGNLGSDPDYKALDTGVELCKLNLGVTTKQKTKDGYTDNTQWINVIVWGGLAKMCADNLHKGGLVYVDGRLTIRKYVSKDGITKYMTEVVADNVVWFDKKTGDVGSCGVNNNDDLPF